MLTIKVLHTKKECLVIKDGEKEEKESVNFLTFCSQQKMNKNVVIPKNVPLNVVFTWNCISWKIYEVSFEIMENFNKSIF